MQRPEQLLDAARSAPVDAAMARRAVGLVDLTLLGDADTDDQVSALCRRAVEARTAAVCIWPRFIPTARPLLDGTGVRLAVVANFPHGGDDIAAAAEETAAAVAAGADEVDVVAPVDAILEGDVGLVGEMIEACRTAAGPTTTLKLILETGRLIEPDTITAAARAGVMAGVDFLKTSTGKIAAGATLEATAVLLSVAAEGRVGVKVAGGVRTAADAAAYLHLADTFLGRDAVTPARFRLGASSLLDDLERVLRGGTSGTATDGY